MTIALDVPRSSPGSRSVATDAAAGSFDPGVLSRELVGIAREVLQLADVDVHTNFFDLGSSSVQLAEIHRRLEQLLDTEVAILDLFQYPTIADFVEHLGGPAVGQGLGEARQRAARQKQALARQQRQKRRGP